MADDGKCFRCNHPLGTNAASCWWCEWYRRSLKRQGPDAPSWWTSAMLRFAKTAPDDAAEAAILREPSPYRA